MNADMNSAEELFLAGVRSMGQHDDAAAESSFRKALELEPELSEALVNLAFLLDARGDLRGAEQLYLRALAAGADQFELHLNFGALLTTTKQFELAGASYERALQLRPDSSALWSNLGALHLGLRDDARALECLTRALELDADNKRARFNLAYLHLSRGELETGWTHLESRDWYAAFESHWSFPRWTGQPIKGKRLLVCYEAGHGDVIHFCRYVTELQLRGATEVTLLCHPPLKALMQTLEGCSRVVGFDEDTSALTADYWTPLLSIPRHLATTSDSIPASIPYLHADAKRMERWGARLPATGLRVGLVWKGNPAFENDAERSLQSLRMLAPLWEVAGVRFVSLQKGAGQEECAAFNDSQPITPIGSELTDFADTAAVVAQLDLVISVDTAVAHLAGAMGKACWVLLPHSMTDWRWLREGDTSAWYPQGMRLFRQKAMGDWPGTISALSLALQEWARLRKLPSC
jgi:tetratricopeptide (TPR) repeat protein